MINKCCAPCTHRCWERSVKCSFVGMGLSKVWALLSQCCLKRNGKTPGLGNQTPQPQLYMWPGHQDLPVNKFLDCSDKNMFKNLTYNLWRKWNFLTTCAELWWTFVRLFLPGRILSQMTPHKHYLVLILYSPGEIQSTGVKNAAFWPRSREYQNLNQCLKRIKGSFVYFDTWYSAAKISTSNE